MKNCTFFPCVNDFFYNADLQYLRYLEESLGERRVGEEEGCEGGFVGFEFDDFGVVEY